MLSLSGPPPHESGILVAPMPALRDGRPPIITSGYRTTSRPDHIGVDVMYLWRPGDPTGHPTSEGRGYVPGGVPALSVGNGAVRYWADYGNGLGVRVDLDSGLQVDYLHLADVAVVKGQRLEPGQTIGTIGHNGGVNHLHFQVLVDGDHVDPAPYLDAIEVLSLASVTAPPGGGGLGTIVLLAGLAGGAYGLYRLLR